ncbi:unnamed protein product [Notodromas monacha]|uniref:C2H2-type domain-containing protein n=1 Tax=Notodromas monacha TaxID=399045 RepID=A0A7R9GK37_9CRUS|nr:unnamed protein product [Notodromas monacha]CAG0923472.1 unnamed protein product [Notodromas monacha]
MTGIFTTKKTIGRGVYSCNTCNKSFKDPNPLKIHLMLDCETQSASDFWARLFKPSSSGSTSAIKTSNGSSRSAAENLAKLGTSSANNGQTLPEFFKPVKFPPNNRGPIDFHQSSIPVTSVIYSRKLNWVRDVVDVDDDVVTRLTRLKDVKRVGLRARDGCEVAKIRNLPRDGYTQGCQHHLRSTGHLRPPWKCPCQQRERWSFVGPGTSSVLQPSPPQPSTPGAHMSNADLETMVSNIGRGKGGHLCLYCGKIYSRKYGLKIHIRTHTGYKPLRCKVCLRPFGDPSNLNKHIRLHAQGDTPYRTHTGYKPLRCKVCLRPFGDPSNLNKHIRLHAQGDTPYRCDLCGKILVRRRDLERHLLSRHPDQAPTSSGLSAENARRQEPDTSGCQSRDADDDQDLDVGTERRPMTSTSSFRVMDLSSSQRRRTSDSSDDFAPSSSTAACEDIDKLFPLPEPFLAFFLRFLYPIFRFTVPQLGDEAPVAEESPVHDLHAQVGILEFLEHYFRHAVGMPIVKHHLFRAAEFFALALQLRLHV